MKKICLATLLLLSLYGCGGSDEHLSEEEIGKIFADQPTLQPQIGDSMPQVQLQTTPKNQYIRVLLPQVEDKGPAHVILKLQIANDTIVSYSLSCSSDEPTTQPVEKSLDNVIRANDTKTSIAKRYGVTPNRVQNKEPLQIGEKIIIK